MTGKSRHLLLLGLVVVIQGTIYIFKPKQRHGLYNRSKRTGATNVWELLTIPDNLRSLPVFSWAQFLVYCVVLCRSLLALFLMTIAWCVHLRFNASEYPIGIFSLHNLSKAKGNVIFKK
jgi:hypothetical protein